MVFGSKQEIECSDLWRNDKCNGGGNQRNCGCFFLGGNESFLEKGKGENLCVKILKIKIGREPGRGTFAQCAILSE